MQLASTNFAASANRDRSQGKRAFIRHFLEMVLAMFAGMLVLGGLAHLAFSLLGSSGSDRAGGTQVMLMALYMTVPMVLWMRHRGHDWARNAEMAGSMILPSLAAAILAWAGVLDTHPALMVQHVVMIPAMLAVMLARYGHYSHPHG